VARSAKKNGWAVLNADDEQCRKISAELDCNIAWFSMDPENKMIKKQIDRGTPVAIYENGYLTIIKGNETIRIENVKNVPVTFEGNARFMVANALAASLAGFVWGFDLETIRESLRNFIPGLTQTPGRLNHFEFENFGVLVDYAHNPHGYTAVEDFLTHVPAQRRIGIISGIGDRRDDDIRECARIAGRMFDYVIIKQEHDLRGRTEEAINALVISGLRESKENIPYEIIPAETEAIRRALAIAGTGDLVVALCDGYQSVIEIIREELLKESAKAVASKVEQHSSPTGPMIISNYKNKYHGRTA
jgi:cyanophycin synthetase